MVPKVHTIVGLLLVGMVVNILIAWACEAFCTTECVDLSGNALLTRRPAAVDGSWQSATAMQEARGLGRTTIWYLRGSIGDVGIHKAGWPFRALQYQINDRPGQWIPRYTSTPAAPTPPTLWAITIPDRPIVPRRLANKLLPVRPIPVGFALNSIFYAAAFLPALLWMTGFIRGRIRAFRGLCRTCGYPIGVSPVCTECGRPVADPAVASQGRQGA